MRYPIRSFILVAFISLLVDVAVPNSSWAKGVGRVGLSAGRWSGDLTQEYQGASSKSEISGSLGFDFRAGLGINSIFFDWNPCYFTSTPLAVNPNSATRSFYASIFSLNAGFSLLQLGILPLEVYVGIEPGWMAFQNGVQIGYDGTTLKFGADFVPLAVGPFTRFGVTAQYRRTYISEDSVGKLPNGATVHLDVFYVGLIIHNAFMKGARGVK